MKIFILLKFLQKIGDRMKTAIHRAEKGVIEVELKFENEFIQEIKITGDFFIYPEEAIEDLEKELVGIKITENDLDKKLQEIYLKNSISTPGITIRDWIVVILKAINP